MNKRRRYKAKARRLRRVQLIRAFGTDDEFDVNNIIESRLEAWASLMRDEYFAEMERDEQEKALESEGAAQAALALHPLD